MLDLEMSTACARGLLTLLQLPAVGTKTAEQLADRFATLQQCHEAAARGEPIPGNRIAAEALRDESALSSAASAAERILEQADRLGVRIAACQDSWYPSLLRRLADRPPLVYIKGTIRPSIRNVACIGTREPSEFGTEVTRRLVRVLGENDWGIVSGLAIGVDSVAHREALACNSYTVAILANGLDRVYPSENRALAEAILENGGALLSEQPFGAPPARQNLVLRDRLQSGMSVATVVMQTDTVGGSMHTVRFTLTQGRLLLAPVPSGSHADEDKSRGILALTQQAGPALATLLNAKDAYRELLLRRFAARPPAMPIRSREDYGEILAALDATQANLAESGPERQPCPADGLLPGPTLFDSPSASGDAA